MKGERPEGLELLGISAARRERVVAHPRLNGIDYIEVISEPDEFNQKRLVVYFLEKTTTEGKNSLEELLGILDGRPERFSIIAGAQAREVQVVKAVKEADHIVLDLDKAGDFTDYYLQIIRSPNGDALYDLLDASLSICIFNFKAACKQRFDCKSMNAIVSSQAPPVIDYMARDFASFKRALLDLMQTRFPEVKDYNDADLGMVLIELFSYVGDMLSYYQDAVSNEAYLGTARHRISVRRHARLIGYQMHDGASARAIVQLKVARDVQVPAGTRILGRIDKHLGPSRALPGTIIDPDLWDEALSSAPVIFETYYAVELHQLLNEIPIYDWGAETCTLSAGTTSLHLVGDLTELLKPGDLLLLEEKQSSSASQRKSQVVRLKGVERSSDPLMSSAENPIILTRVTWDKADALTFSLPVREGSTANVSGPVAKEPLSVASANLVVADHGLGVKEHHPSDQESSAGISLGKRAYRFYLQNLPVSLRVPLPEASKNNEKASKNKDAGPGGGPAAALQSMPTGKAKPEINISSIGPSEEEWSWQPDLLESHSTDNHFTLETDNNGRALIRFGDGENGRAPPQGTRFCIVYRVGAGERGNVGAGTLAHILPPDDDLHLHSGESSAFDISAITEVRNPLPTWGGAEPEDIEKTKRLAPSSFYDQPRRAVTEEDYERAAQSHSGVSKALARFQWTGSWFTVFVHVDPIGGYLLKGLEDELYEILRAQAIAGYDVKILPPKYVALDIEISVNAKDGYYSEHVEAAVREALSSGIDSRGEKGFFHPDKFTFGQTLYISQLYAAVEKVTGVQSAIVLRFQRLGRKSAGELESGRIETDTLEILRLDNDRSHPEYGLLKIYMTGGL